MPEGLRIRKGDPWLLSGNMSKLTIGFKTMKHLTGSECNFYYLPSGIRRQKRESILN